MGKTDELAIVIRAQDYATKTFERVRGALTNIKKDIDQFTGGAFATFRANWMAITAAVYAFVRAVETAWNLAEKAAKFHEQKASLDALARAYGTTADEILSNIDRQSKGLVRMGAAVEVAGKAMVRGMTPEQIGNLARAAETLSNITGDDVTDSFSRMTEAISLGRERGVESAAVVVDLRDKYGDLVNEMSESRKRTELYVYTMEKADAVQGLLGDTTDSVSDRMDRFLNQIAAMKETLGEWIIRAAAGLMATFQSVAALALGLARVVMAPITALMLATDYLGITQGKAEEYKAAMEGLGDAAEYTAYQARDNFRLLYGDIDKIAPKAKGALDAINKLKGGDRNPQHERQIADAEKKITEMYRQLSASRAKTESEFTREKIKEFENSSKITFDKLPAEYKSRFLAVVKSEWEKIEGDRLKAQEAMFRELAEQTKASANKMSQYESESATNAKEDAVRFAMKMDEMYLSSREIDEAEATRRRYDNEIKLLEIGKERLLDATKWTESWEELQGLGLEYARLTVQIGNLEKERIYAVAQAEADRFRERLVNVRKIEEETAKLYMTGRAREAAELRAAYADDVDSHREMVRQKQITWVQYDEWVKAREWQLQEDLKRLYGDQMDGMRDAWRDYFDKLGNDYERGRTMMDQALAGMEGSLGRMFENMRSKGDFIRQFWRDLTGEMYKIWAQAMARMSMQLIGGGLSSLFGLGTPAPAASGVSLSGGSYGFSGMPGPGQSWFGGGMAGGGDVRAGITYLIGERGPELFRPKTSGTIVPNGELGSQRTEVRGVTINNNWTIMAQDTASMDQAIMARRSMIDGMFYDNLARAGIVRDAIRRYR